jgi:cell division protein FtsB
MKFVTLALVALLALVHAQLWLDKGGVRHVMHMRSQLADQQSANEQARERNQRLGTEVADLKEGLEMVEEKARGELSMVKPDEILVLVSTPRR